MIVYLPMTADIITPGHIKAILKAREYGSVVIGLLTDRALKGYKEATIKYPDRKYVLEFIASGINGVMVIPQDKLNPYYNLDRFGCKFLASGDGFEDEERRAATALDIELLDIKLDGEETKTWSSSKVKDKILKKNG